MTDPRPPRATDDYPRPSLVRDRWRSLDGEWQFGYDDDNRGVAGGWYARDQTEPFDRAVVVPYPPESPASGIGETGFHPIVWYRRTLTVGDLCDGALGDDRLLIHFGAVDHDTTVWFDGVFVGAHSGGQTPFWVDVADVLHTSASDVEHVLVVRAEEDPRDRSLLRGKQDWKPEPHGIWYHRSTGIWQTVWAEPAPLQRIDDVAWIPDLDTASVTFEAELAAWPTTDLEVEATLTLAGAEIARITVAAESRTVRASIPVKALRSEVDRRELLWSPDRPTLVDAHVVARERGGVVVDSVGSYLGLRSVGVAEGRFVLNDEPVYVRAVLDQGYRAETHLANRGTDQLRREVELIRDLGFNTVRVHQKAEDPRFLAWADRLGVMVWGETANAHENTPRSQALLTSEWTALVRRDRSHPSIVAWVPINESWGVDEIAQQPSQQAFAAAMAALTRSLDPSRPVMSDEGWHHVDSDILGVHDYASKPDVLRERYGDLAAVHRTLAGPGPAKRKLILNRRQRERFDRGEAPLMLTEFGGVAYAGNPGKAKSWGYSTVSSDVEYERLLWSLFDAVRDCKPVAGYCYTQLVDCAQEANGLLREDGSPKLPVETIRAIVTGR